MCLNADEQLPARLFGFKTESAASPVQVKNSDRLRFRVLKTRGSSKLSRSLGKILCTASTSYGEQIAGTVAVVW